MLEIYNIHPTPPPHSTTGVPQSILSHRRPSEAQDPPQDSVTDGVVAEDPVIGAGGGRPVGVSGAAAPAGVQNLVAEVLRAGPQSGPPRRGVDGLIAGEEAGVGGRVGAGGPPVEGRAPTVGWPPAALGGRAGQGQHCGGEEEVGELHVCSFVWRLSDSSLSLQAGGWTAGQRGHRPVIAPLAAARESRRHGQPMVVSDTDNPGWLGMRQGAYLL